LSIYVSGLLTLGACLYLLTGSRVELLLDRWQSSFRPVIGVVTSARNDVRRRTSEKLQWLPLASRGSLYEDDGVFTGEDSTAELVLSDQLRIQMSPLSMIRLR